MTQSMYLKWAERLLITVAVGVGIARFLGLVKVSLVNTMSTWILGHPILVPAMQPTSILMPAEDAMLGLIDAFAWMSVVSGGGAVVLIAVLWLWPSPESGQEHNEDSFVAFPTSDQ